MINITRQFAFQFRNLMRRMGLQSRSAWLSAPVLFLASAEGLHVRAVNGSCALEYHQPGPLPPAQFAVPVEALGNCEGKYPTAVAIESAAEGRVSLRWEDRSMPVVRMYDDRRAKVAKHWPKRPKTFSTNDQKILGALRAAAGVVDQFPTPRLATHTVQLQGRTGKVIATDTRQALVIRGEFKFPWDNDVLLVPTDVFGFPDFPADAPVEFGATDTHVFVRIRPWSLYLARVTNLRYPDVEEACPLRAGVRTRVQIPAADRDFLARNLSRLPGNEVSDAPVTVDCNGKFAIRAQVRGETPLTELVLSRSTVTGEPQRLNVNRVYLEHAIQLGFSELQIVDPNSPCIFDDESRTYFWMALGANDSLGPSKECVRLESAAGSAAGSATDSTTGSTTDQRETIKSPLPVLNVPDERFSKMARISRTANMPSTNGSPQPAEQHGEISHTNGHTAGGANGSTHSPGVSELSAKTPQNGVTATTEQPGGGTSDTANIDPITAAETLHDDLRTALASTSRLLQVLRRNRKQHKLVQSTLDSLRQLQTVS